MKVFFALAALLAVALAEDMMAAESYPVASYQVGPAVAASSAGNAYGAYGAKNSGYGAYGKSQYGDSGLYSDRARAAQGYHNIGAARSRDAYGAQASNYGKYRNVGAYAQDKGAGYEKAYAYDKRAGNHAITSDYGANKGSYGVQDRKAYHNLGGYANAGRDRYGAHNRYGANAYGVNAHDNSAYGRYGSAQAQSLRVAPAVSSYAAAPVVSSYGAPAVSSYGAAPVASSYGAPARY